MDVCRVVAISAASLLLLSGAAKACPLPGVAGVALDPGSEVMALGVVAGGPVELARCDAITAQGFVAREPDFSLMPRREVQARGIELRVDSGCDTVLLASDGADGWHFDDDSGPDGAASLTVAVPPTGRLDVWVGTYGAARCTARLVVRLAG